MDFARVLVVAIVLFAALLLIFGGELEFEPDPEEDPERYRFRPIDKTISDFFVGSIMETDYRHMVLSAKPFELSFEERTEILGELDEADVRRGFLRNEPHYLEFNLTGEEVERVRSLAVDFDVAETNQLNTLRMLFNDEKFYEGYADAGRSYSRDLDLELLEKRNFLEITAGSSGWRFWAPTVYVLGDIEVTGDVIERQEKSFEFELDEDQAQNFEMGRLVLRPDRFVPNEPLFIEVNGQRVYGQRTEMPDRRSLWIEFEDVAVNEGKNEIRMFTEEGGLYSFDRATMVVFWESLEEKRPVRYIDVSRSEYRRLPGEITFTVDGVEGYPEHLTLKLTTADDEERELMIERPLVEGERITIDVTRDDLDVGENRLEFVVGGEGGYYLSDFKVSF